MKKLFLLCLTMAIMGCSPYKGTISKYDANGKEVFSYKVKLNRAMKLNAKDGDTLVEADSREPSLIEDIIKLWTLREIK